MGIRRIVDLSHGIDAGTQVYPGDPEPSLRPASTIRRDGFNVLHVQMGSHTGTHVDAPYHFVDDGARVDEIDLRLVLAPAVIVDIRGHGDRAPVRWNDLRPYAEQLQPGRIVVLHTGWSRHWRTPRYLDHPYLDADAAQRLMDLGIRTVALDALNLDQTAVPGDQPTFDSHDAVLGAGGLIAENLTNLEAIDWSDPVVSLLPIRLTGGDGAPVRAVALELDEAEE